MLKIVTDVADRDDLRRMLDDLVSEGARRMLMAGSKRRSPLTSSPVRSWSMSEGIGWWYATAELGSGRW